MEPFKNIFNKDFVISFATNIKKYSSSFEKDKYLKTVLDKLESLELKQRMRLISSTVNTYLQTDYKQSIEILKNTKNDFQDNKNKALQLMILPDFVEVYGLEDLDTSLEALEFFTIDSSSEFAIRHFLIKDEIRTLAFFDKWSKSSNEHIRRLSSEGSRPRLPWGVSLPVFKKDPTLILAILNELKNDESLYVRRSVANNLNDISKDNPSVVIDFIKQNIGKNKDCDWLLKHAARTLLKKGDVQTLGLFGYIEIKNLKINDFHVQDSVNTGEYLDFSFVLTTNKLLCLLRIEYEIDFQMANEKRSKKVYMISQSNVKNNTKEINKKHSFKIVTTRKYYLGLHHLTLIVNGVKVITKSFNLK
jgi:3-methyladenine DNA glycosylase AlkC